MRTRLYAQALLALAPLAAATSAAAAHPPQADPRIAAARRHGDSLLAIFPTHVGTIACRIGYGGPTGGVMPGTCTTSLRRLSRGKRFGGQSVVAFTERWQWPPPGTRGEHRSFSHTWLVRVGRRLAILEVEQCGAPPPQLWA